MRRGGVSPWIATIAAALFTFFGAGYTNIIDGFQIGLVGSLVFGLTHLLLADHDGPLDRRDAVGLGAGFAGLLCSGVAVPMTIVVGITMLLRRGWRIALLHTAPLGIVYSLWAQRYPPGRSTFGKLTPRILPGLHHPQPSDDVRVIGSGPVGRCGSCGDARRWEVA